MDDLLLMWAGGPADTPSAPPSGESTETFDSLPESMDVSELESAVITDGALVTQAKAGTAYTPPLSAAFIPLAVPITGDFEISVAMSWVANDATTVNGELGLYLRDADRETIAYGMVYDAWKTSLGVYWAGCGDQSYTTSDGIVPTTGSLTIRFTRLSGEVKIYLNDVLRVTKTGVSTAVAEIALVNTRNATNAGYTVTWDNLYVKWENNE